MGPWGEIIGILGEGILQLVKAAEGGDEDAKKKLAAIGDTLGTVTRSAIQMRLEQAAIDAKFPAGSSR